MFYGEVFRALNKARVKYVVAGGVAVVLHGYQRFTKDLDIIVALEEKNLARLFDALGRVGYGPKVPVTKEAFAAKGQFAKWKKEKGMVVFSFVQKKPPFDLIDMFIQEPVPFAQLDKEKKKIRVDNVAIPIASIRHLVGIKKKAGRDKDLNDVVQLKAIAKFERKKSAR